MNTDKKVPPFVYIIFFVLITGAIITAGIVYYRNFEQRFRSEVERQLTAIAELKMAGLMQWRKDRIEDASLFYRNTSFSQEVQDILQNPSDRSSADRLRVWLSKALVNNQYDQIFIVKDDGSILVSVPSENVLMEDELSKGISMALQIREVVIVDFYRSDVNQKIYLALVVPILADQDGSQNLGALVIRVNPNVYLYPFVKLWPTPSQSAETLIVRREGNAAVFLNELRFKSNSALNLSIPTEEVDKAAVKAVLGYKGVIEGNDYRGVPIVADVRPIPGSPWYLVSRMDVTEVYAPVRERLWEMVAIVSALVVLSIAGLLFFWRQQNLQQVKERYKERASAAEALRENNEYLENLIDYANAPIIVWDTNYRINRFNRAFEKLTGMKQDEVIGQSVDILFPTEARDGAMALIQKTLVGERWESEEIPVNQMGGSTRNVLWNSASIRSISGIINAVIAHGTDITLLKEKERNLQDKNEELERFNYTVSHDLRTPLVTIKTFLGYLEKDIQICDTKRIAQDMHYIDSAADKMRRLLDDLLDLSRVGWLTHAVEEIAYQELVQQVLESVAGPISERGVEIEIGQDNLILNGDRARLAEIWQNLVENSVKFMGDQREPRIVIGFEKQDGDTVFFVRDNGSGIVPKYHEKVFGLFERLNKEIEGTGIGLALVRRIVGLYNGVIWVDGEYQGQGTCFRFTLPGAIKI